MNAMTSSPDTQQIFDVIANYQKASVVFPLKTIRLICTITEQKQPPFMNRVYTKPSSGTPGDPLAILGDTKSSLSILRDPWPSSGKSILELD